MGKEKYVFFDIDGTIYDYHTGIPDSTREAIRLLRENGHHPIICTGRTRVMVFDEIGGMGFDGIIAGAGAYVEWGNKVVFRDELERKEIIRIIECFRKNKFVSYAEGNEYFYYDPLMVKKGQEFDGIYKIYQREIPEYIRPIDFETIRCSKVSASYTSESNPRGVYDELGKDYYCVDHKSLFETIPKKLSKGVGIKCLIDYLGADLEDTFAYGDSYNDYDMLKTVKYGIVMENGNEDLKKEFPLHAPDMMDDGIYKSLKEFELI